MFDNCSRNIAIWIGVVVFVQLTIITPYFDPVENERIGEAQKQIEILVNSHMSALSKIKDSEKEQELREMIYKLNKEHVELNEKRKRRKFKIPVFDIEVSKRSVVILYPLLIFTGLGYVLLSRHRYLKGEIRENNTPFWVYPVLSAPWLKHDLKEKVMNNLAVILHIFPIVWVFSFMYKQYMMFGIRQDYFVLLVMLSVIFIGLYLYVLTKTFLVSENN